MAYTEQLSAREHARSLYLQMLAQLKRYNEAETDIQAVYDAELKRSDPATAMIKAAEWAVHSGLLSKRNNSRDAVQMLGTAYLVTVDWMDRSRSS